MASPLEALSPLSNNHVLNFLPLTDCLQYSQVSKQALVDVLPNLKERRRKQFGQRHAYQLSDPGRLVSVKDIDSLENPNNFVQSESEDQWQVLPSVAERLEGLYQAIPHSHDGKEMARELWMDVQDDQDNDQDENTTACDFADSLQKLHSLLQAHRLHNLLLSRSTLRSHPPPADPSITIHNDLTLTVTLDQYMGDVLIANTLMAHSIAKLVEGPTTYKKWTELLTKEVLEDTGTPEHGYRQWIYMHSTILRTLPLQATSLVQMKLTPLCGIPGEAGEGVDYIKPPLPFLASPETTEILKILAGPLRRHFWSHSTRLDDFGPLGPALFRGRDRIRSIVMSPGNLLRHLGMFHAMYNAMDHGFFPMGTTLFAVWLGPSDAETRTWMRNLSNECYRNRPMTVQPPLVTISRRWD